MTARVQSAQLNRTLRGIDISSLIALACLGLLVGSVAVGLGAALRDQNGLLLAGFSWLAALVSWKLAGSPLRTRQAGIFLTLLGLALILIGTAPVNEHLFLFHLSLIKWIGAVAMWRIDQPLPDPGPALRPAGEFFAISTAALDRFANWFFSIAKGQAVDDPQAARWFWEFVSWTASIWAAWATRRIQKPLLGTIPAVAILSVVLSSTRADALYLTPAFAGALLVNTWHHHASLESRWKKYAIDYAEDLRFDTAMWSLAFIVIVTGTAMALSVISPQQSLRAFREWVQSEASKTDGTADPSALESPPSESQVGEFSSPGVLPRQHLLGSGPELSDEIAIIVQIEETAPGNQSCATPPCLPYPGRFYWRLLSFDLYTGRGWMTSPTSRLQYMRYESTIRNTGLEISEFIQNVQTLDESSTQIYSFGDPIRVDQDFEAFWRKAPEGEKDLFSARLRQPPRQSIYQVVSTRPLINPETLQSNQAEYPEWILERYLQLPQKTPERIFALADALTEAATSRYEKALSIERYLRSIPYSLEVPTPPPDRDVVDYYLYEIGSGYCDYAATAMVVLARAAGLPARIAIGYASGKYDPQSNRYIVTLADAHSWAEVYFPEIGWVEFEPTSGQPQINHPAETTQLPYPEIPPPPSSDSAFLPAVWLTLWKVFFGLVLGVVVLWILWFIGDFWRLSRQKPDATMMTLYRRMWRLAGRLKSNPQASWTPNEFGAHFARTLANQTQGSSRSIFFASSQAVHALSALYSRAIYSPEGISEAESRLAIRTWNRLNLNFWLAWTRGRIFSARRIGTNNSHPDPGAGDSQNSQG